MEILCLNAMALKVSPLFTVYVLPDPALEFAAGFLDELDDPDVAAFLSVSST
jgi:hypothetical protein